jgi:hypothetical protein
MLMHISTSTNARRSGLQVQGYQLEPQVPDTQTQYLTASQKNEPTLPNVSVRSPSSKNDQRSMGKDIKLLDLSNSDLAAVNELQEPPTNALTPFEDPTTTL